MDERPSGITFADLLAQKQWSDYTSFIAEAPATYAAEVGEDIQREEALRQEIRSSILEQKFEVRRFEPLLKEAEKLLFSGGVVGIDGTVSKYRMLSGLRCQIGIVAVNYANEKVRQSYFISEACLQTATEDVVEALRRREARNRVISDMVIRALLLYREREVAMRHEYRDAFRMLHGPLLPFELMTGLGRLRALEATLTILERGIEDPKCFSIISASSQDDYLTLGMALEKGEYLVDPGYTLGDEVADNPDFMAEGKWRPSEFGRMREFLHRYASRILVGVIRVSERPYVFHAHRESFDLAAAIIARDALLQREKGFPLLIDYADTLCSEYFPAGDFANLLIYKLAKEGHLLSQASERMMRVK